MKRKMKLICMILAHAEKAPHIGGISLPELADYTEEEIQYHVKLCSQAGYLDIAIEPQYKLPRHIDSLTWEGHEALDRLRAENGF